MRHALGKYSITPVLDFDQNVNYDLAHVQGTAIPSSASGPASKSGFDHHFQRQGPSTQEISQWGKEFEELVQADTTSPEDSVIISSKLNSEVGGLEHDLQIKSPVQLDKRFIISQIKSGLIVLDQQAAHERIIFERLCQAMSETEVLTQAQLFPVSYTHLRAHETLRYLVCRLLLEKKN